MDAPDTDTSGRAETDTSGRTRTTGTHRRHCERLGNVITLPAPNALTRPYRGLSVQEVDIPLGDESAILDYLVGRDAYRRTEWLLLGNGDQHALVEIRKESNEPLMSPIIEALVLAGPDRTVWIDEPGTDVGNATAMAAAAALSGRTDADAFAVKGRYEHVNAIWRPTPVRIVVTEVVPPEPAKLLEMARQAVAFDDELPPIDLVLDAVDIRHIAADNPAQQYLLPCRGSGVDLPAPVAFLDTRPAGSDDWLLIGCERSMQFHRDFYGTDPRQVDLCPHRRSRRLAESTLVLTKCCLLERGVEQHGNEMVVPWGSTLDEVRLALRMMTKLGPVTEAPRQGSANAL